MNNEKRNKEKKSILFVCLGNICRSPAAEGIMKQVVSNKGIDKNFFIDSAGIGSWHIGQLPDRRMRKHGAKRGYDFNSRARQVSISDFNKFDYFLAMDEKNYSALSSMARNWEERNKIHYMTDYIKDHPNDHIIPDPYYGSDAGFELVLNLLEDACDGLLEDIQTNI